MKKGIPINFYLVRHGEAMPAAHDAARPLSVKGVTLITKLADHLAGLLSFPPHIFASTKLRAMETAEILLSRLNPSASVSQIQGLLPDDDPNIICALPGEYSGDLMVVSHLPLLGIALSGIVQNSSEQPLPEFYTGTFVHIKGDPSGWSLERCIHATAL